MLMITLPACPSIEEWAHVEAALALGQHVVLRAVDGRHDVLRQGIARVGVLDVTDGGEAGLELHPTRA
jgi:hypothetical protein